MDKLYLVFNKGNYNLFLVKIEKKIINKVCNG